MPLAASCRSIAAAAGRGSWQLLRDVLLARGTSSDGGGGVATAVAVVAAAVVGSMGTLGVGTTPADAIWRTAGGAAPWFAG